MILITNWASSQQTWNVVIANWRDLSPENHDNLTAFLKQSLVTELSRTPDFNIIEFTNDAEIENIIDAKKWGREYEADIIIYGNFYMQGQDLVIYVEIYDVLNLQSRGSDYYTGKATIDLFDTLDYAIGDIVNLVRNVLPELTIEEGVETEQVRQTLYEQENIEIRRQFLTHIGILSQFANYSPIYSIENSSDPSTFNGSYNSFMLNYGLTLRYGNIQFHADLCSLPGFPTLLWGDLQNSPTWTGISSLNTKFWNASLIYFLPWLNNSIGVGASIVGYDFMTRMTNYVSTDVSDSESLYKKDTLRFSQQLSIQFGFQPSDWLQIFVSFCPFGNYFATNDYTYTEGSETHVRYEEEHYSKSILTPITFRLIIYPTEKFGIELSAFYNWHKVERFEWYSNEVPEVRRFIRSSEGAIWYFYLGAIYKMDFMGKKES